MMAVYMKSGEDTKMQKQSFKRLRTKRMRALMAVRAPVMNMGRKNRKEKS
jgi:hypothetical protein